MAETVDKYILQIVADNKEAIKNILAVQNQTDKIGKKSAGFFSQMKAGWLAVAAAVAVGVKIMGDMVKKALESVDAQTELSTTMKKQGTYTREAFNELKKYAGQLAMTTRYEDDQIVTLEASLTRYGLHGKALKDATAATLDFATAKKMDLATAGEIVGKTYATNNNMLARYSAITVDATDKTQRAAQVIGGLQRSFGGEAVAAGNNFVGSLKLLAKTGDEIQESLGKAVLVGIAPAISNLREFIGTEDGMKRIDKVVKGLAVVFVVVGAAIGATVKNIVSIISSLVDSATLGFSAVKKAIQGDFKGAFEDTRKFVGVQVNFVKEQIQNTKDFYTTSWSGIGKVFSDQMDEELEKYTITKEKEKAIRNASSDSEEKGLQLDKQRKADAYDTLKNILGQTSDLMASENKTQFEIGKAAALANSAIATREMAIQSYKSVAGIIPIGPVLGPIAAAAAIALGLLNISKIASTQFNPPKAARGALVNGPTVLMAGESGRELVLPNNITEALLANIDAAPSSRHAVFNNSFIVTGAVLDDMVMKNFTKDIMRHQDEIIRRNEAY